jgi:hypothetical protein
MMMELGSPVQLVPLIRRSTFIVSYHIPIINRTVRSASSVALRQDDVGPLNSNWSSKTDWSFSPFENRTDQVPNTEPGNQIQSKLVLIL